MKPLRPVILVIEDDPQMRRFLRVSLTSNGFQLFEANTADEGLMQAAARAPDLILLDLGLPDRDGLAVTERLRQWTKTPIIVISARGQEQDKILALDAGADDYLTKPFGMGELLARIRVSFRHSATSSAGSLEFKTGELNVDLVRRRVLVAGKEVHLTPIEYKLLATLIKSAGRVVTHHQLLREVWGPNSSAHTEYLRVYMAQLRRKVEPNPSRPLHFLTEPGVGYRLRADD